MEITRFKNDALGFEAFEGYTKGENWNGWDCPYFTFEQAQKILKIHNELKRITGEVAQAYYDFDNDFFAFPVADDETEIYKPIVENNKKYYPIGAFTWIWEEVELDFPVEL
jgi:hypothetical protein